MAYVPNSKWGQNGFDVEFDVSQYTCDNEWSNCLSLWLHDDLLQLLRLVLDLAARQRVESEVASDGSSDSLEAQQIVSVSSHFDLVHDFLRDIDSVSVAVHSVHLHLDCVTELHLESDLGANVFELFLSYS